MCQLRKYTAIIILLILISNPKLYSQYIFHTLDVSDGLPENTVKCIAQDEQGFIWFGTFNGLCRFDGVDFLTFRHEPDQTSSIADNYVPALLSYKGGLWVGTDRGIDFYSIKENQFYHGTQITADGKISFLEQHIKNIVSVAGQIFIQDKSGRLYARKENTLFELCDYEKEYWYSICPYKDSLLLAHAYDGLYLIDANTRKIISRSGQMALGPSESVYYSKNQDIVYIGYGVGKPTDFYRITNEYQIQKAESNAPADVDRIIDYGNETLFGTNGKGLISFYNNNLTAYTTANSTISSDVITTLFVDSNKSLWIGTYRDGANLYSNHFGWFKSLTVDKRQLTHKLVTGIASDGKQLYLGLDGGGINVYDRSSGKLSSYTTINSSIAGNNVISLANDGQYIWIGIYQEGLCRFSPKDRTFKAYPLHSNYIWEIKDDGEGHVWVIGRDVYVFHKENGNYTAVDSLKGIWASGIALDGDAVWLSTSSSGIYKLDRKKRTVLKHYRKDSKEYPLSDNPITYLFVDSKRQLWYSPRNSGLFRLEEKDGTITAYGEKDGLTTANIAAISEDSEGYLWIGTDNGLFRFNPQTETFIGFGKGDNLPSTQFNHGACHREGDMIYFGSTNGLVYFDSKKINYDEDVSPAYIRNIKLLNNGQVIHINEKENAQPINLSHSQNFFTIEFSAPEFVSPDKMRFSCRMENFEEEWREVRNDRQVTYTNIPPGKYAFYVRTLDRNGQWSNKMSCLHINIAPPWWQTNWATCLWIVLVAGILFIIYRFYRYQENIKKLAEAEETEKNMVKRDNEMKLRFFTNISHEFRTPLSLIISPLEVLIKNEPDGTLRNKLSSIHKNAKSLLALVNQLLDFRKLEMNGEKLNLTYGDVVEFADIIFQTFKENAANEHKDLTLTAKAEHLYMSFDKDKMRKVINNLLSNAFKFTSEGSQIDIMVSKGEENGKGYAILQVSDTGFGIPADKLPHIFERFYQSDHIQSNNTGSGIGLHIVKEYVELHNGKLKVESTLHKGSVFTIYIPVDLQQPTVHSPEAQEMEGTPPEICQAEGSVRKTLLIVEDNSEFRQFLVEQLEAEFRIVQAPDGEQGEQVALKESPDLIITDIMMPKVDGVELCKRIKTNIQTSHIPVILLTARASNEFMFTGYEAGADEYVSKPFDLDILLLKLRKLIKQQEERKAQFRNSIEIKPDDITITSLDEKLIQNALKAIEENLSNTEYSIDNLSNDVGLGRTNLYKKIQSITGKTPASFIRSIRLKKAAQLLCRSDLNISEVADHVGFGNIKYFNQHFKEEFGMTPTQYRVGRGGRQLSP